MKAKVTRQLGVVPGWESPLVTTLPNGRRVIEVGTIIDQAEHPEADCVRLVKNGEGIPLDDECREACRMSPQQIDAAQRAIHRMYSMPDDDEGDDDDEESEE